MTADAEYDASKWAFFDWRLNHRYRDRTCLAFHLGSRGGLEAVLVRPSPHEAGEVTFASILPWATIENLAGLGKGWHRVKKADPGYQPLIRALGELEGNGEESYANWFASCNQFAGKFKEYEKL